ncbi:MAG: aldehyde dehydrogenase (NADP(+)), partial [Planctomycetota bacterium]
GVARSLGENLSALQKAGAENLTRDAVANGKGYCHPNTLLRIAGSEFLKSPGAFQAEAFGNASLLVIADDVDQVGAIADNLEGNLTGCIYSESKGKDDVAYDQIAPRLRVRVGRLLNDKMPTGVAVSSAMNHGGPFPATGHPGFTAVGIPASLVRFAMLQCYDNVRPHRLPANLQDKNPTGRTWRLIDGAWSQGDVGR